MQPEMAGLNAANLPFGTPFGRLAQLKRFEGHDLVKILVSLDSRVEGRHYERPAAALVLGWSVMILGGGCGGSFSFSVCNSSL